MTARTKLAPEDQLTIEEFLVLTDTRPDGERWELIEGVAIMNPAPVEFHQVIVANLLKYLMVHKERTGASWRRLASRCPWPTSIAGHLLQAARTR